MKSPYSLFKTHLKRGSRTSQSASQDVCLPAVPSAYRNIFHRLPDSPGKTAASNTVMRRIRFIEYARRKHVIFSVNTPREVPAGLRNIRLYGQNSNLTLFYRYFELREHRILVVQNSGSRFFQGMRFCLPALRPSCNT